MQNYQKTFEKMFASFLNEDLLFPEQYMYGNFKYGKEKKRKE